MLKKAPGRIFRVESSSVIYQTTELLHQAGGQDSGKAERTEHRALGQDSFGHSDLCSGDAMASVISISLLFPFLPKTKTQYH